MYERDEFHMILIYGIIFVLSLQKNCIFSFILSRVNYLADKCFDFS